MARVKRYVRFAARFCIPLFSVEVNRARWKLNAIISQQRGRNFAERNVVKACPKKKRSFLVLDGKGKKYGTNKFSTSIGSIFRLSRYRFEKSRLKFISRTERVEITRIT